MSVIVVENHGPLIIGSNYWNSDYAAAGKLYVSVNAGAIRLLVPRTARAIIEEMRTAREVVLSRGPWQQLADQKYLTLLAERGWSSWVAPPEQEKERERLWALAREQTETVELLFDDGSETPFALHLSPESFDFLPAKPEPGGEWTFTAWTDRKGRPHLSLQRVCHWRRVERIPCLRPWSETND